MSKENVTVEVPYPHEEVFKDEVLYSRLVEDRHNVTNVTIFERVDYPAEGGRLFYEQGIPFPKKGHPFPEAVYRNDYVKRILVSQARFFAKHPLMAIGLLRKKGLEDWLSSVYEVFKVVMRPVILKDRFYSHPCWELGVFFREFLVAYGIKKGVADSVGRMVATIFEYDDAYRYYLEDLASMTTKERLHWNAPLTFKDMVECFELRFVSKKGGKIFSNLRAMQKIIRLAWWSPKFRRCFRTALDAIDFKRIQMDDADFYHVLLFANYNFGGWDIESRRRLWKKYHPEGDPPTLQL